MITSEIAPAAGALDQPDAHDDWSVASGRPGGTPSARIIIIACILAVLCGVGGAAAAVGAALTRPKVYRAVAEIEYRQFAITETAEVLVASRNVWGPIADSFDLDPVKFEERLGAATVGGTQAIQVWYDDESEAQALLILEQIVERHLGQFDDPSVAGQIDRLEEQLAVLRDLEADLVALVTELTEQAGNVPTPVLSERLSELTGVRQQITNVLGQIDQRATEGELTAESELPNVITPPYVLDDPVEPQLARMAILGFGMGIMLAGVAAFFLFNRDVQRNRPRPMPDIGPVVVDLP